MPRFKDDPTWFADRLAAETALKNREEVLQLLCQIIWGLCQALEEWEDDASPILDLLIHEIKGH